MSLLPSRSDAVADADAEPRVVGVESERADELLAALGSRTARQLLSELHAEPASPAALADRADTSIQNAQYHLGRLEESDAIEVIDTVYSEKGREMAVYAPTDSPLVIVASDDETTTGLRAALARLLGAIGILGLASALVQQVFGDGIEFGTLGGADSSATGGEVSGGADGSGGAGGASGAGGDSTTLAEVQGGDATSGGLGGGGVGSGGSGATEAHAATTGGENVTLGEDGTLVGDAANASGMTTTSAGTPTSNASEAATTATDHLDAADPVGNTPGADGVTEVAANATRTVTQATHATARTTTHAATRTARAATDAVGGADLGGLPPGLLFFLGGLAILGVGVAVVHARR